MQLPIPIESILAVVFVLGFMGWTVFWEDRREEKSMLDSLIDNFDESDGEFIERTGKHVR